MASGQGFTVNPGIDYSLVPKKIEDGVILMTVKYKEISLHRFILYKNEIKVSVFGKANIRWKSYPTSSWAPDYPIPGGGR